MTAAGDPVLGRNGQPVSSAPTARSTRARSTSCCSTTRARRATTSSPARPAGAGQTGHVRAGALEGSGADAARSMVDMIASMRAFEAGQKVIQTIDETLGKAATHVGSHSAG